MPVEIRFPLYTPLSVTDMSKAGLGLWFVGVTPLGAGQQYVAKQEELIMNNRLGISQDSEGDFIIKIMYRNRSEVDYSQIASVAGVMADWNPDKNAVRNDPAKLVLGGPGCPLTGYSLLSNGLQVSVDFSSFPVGLYAVYFTITLTDGTVFDFPEPNMISLEVR